MCFMKQVLLVLLLFLTIRFNHGVEFGKVHNRRLRRNYDKYQNGYIDLPWNPRTVTSNTKTIKNYNKIQPPNNQDFWNNRYDYPNLINQIYNYKKNYQTNLNPLNKINMMYLDPIVINPFQAVRYIRDYNKQLVSTQNNYDNIVSSVRDRMGQYVPDLVQRHQNFPYPNRRIINEINYLMNKNQILEKKIENLEKWIQHQEEKINLKKKQYNSLTRNSLLQIDNSIILNNNLMLQEKYIRNLEKYIQNQEKHIENLKKYIKTREENILNEQIPPREKTDNVQEKHIHSKDNHVHNKEKCRNKEKHGYNKEDYSHIKENKIYNKRNNSYNSGTFIQNTEKHKNNYENDIHTQKENIQNIESHRGGHLGEKYVIDKESHVFQFNILENRPKENKKKSILNEKNYINYPQNDDKIENEHKHYEKHVHDKEHHDHKKENYIYNKEKYIHDKENYINNKENHNHNKEHHVHNKEKHNHDKENHIHNKEKHNHKENHTHNKEKHFHDKEKDNQNKEKYPYKERKHILDGKKYINCKGAHSERHPNMQNLVYPVLKNEIHDLKKYTYNSEKKVQDFKKKIYNLKKKIPILGNKTAEKSLQNSLIIRDTSKNINNFTQTNLQKHIKDKLFKNQLKHSEKQENDKPETHVKIPKKHIEILENYIKIPKKHIKILENYIHNPKRYTESPDKNIQNMTNTSLEKENSKLVKQIANSLHHIYYVMKRNINPMKQSRNSSEYKKTRPNENIQNQIDSNLNTRFSNSTNQSPIKQIGRNSKQIRKIPEFTDKIHDKIMSEEIQNLLKQIQRIMVQIETPEKASQVMNFPVMLILDALKLIRNPTKQLNFTSKNQKTLSFEDQKEMFVRSFIEILKNFNDTNNRRNKLLSILNIKKQHEENFDRLLNEILKNVRDEVLILNEGNLKTKNEILMALTENPKVLSDISSVLIKNVHRNDHLKIPKIPSEKPDIFDIDLKLTNDNTITMNEISKIPDENIRSIKKLNKQKKLSERSITVTEQYQMTAQNLFTTNKYSNTKKPIKNLKLLNSSLKRVKNINSNELSENPTVLIQSSKETIESPKWLIDRLNMLIQNLSMLLETPNIEQREPKSLPTIIKNFIIHSKVSLENLKMMVKNSGALFDEPKLINSRTSNFRTFTPNPKESIQVLWRSNQNQQNFFRDSNTSVPERISRERQKENDKFNSSDNKKLFEQIKTSIENIDNFQGLKQGIDYFMSVTKNLQNLTKHLLEKKLDIDNVMKSDRFSNHFKVLDLDVNNEERSVLKKPKSDTKSLENNNKNKETFLDMIENFRKSFRDKKRLIDEENFEKIFLISGIKPSSNDTELSNLEIRNYKTTRTKHEPCENKFLGQKNIRASAQETPQFFEDTRLIFKKIFDEFDQLDKTINFFIRIFKEFLEDIFEFEKVNIDDVTLEKSYITESTTKSNLFSQTVDNVFESDEELELKNYLRFLNYFKFQNDSKFQDIEKLQDYLKFFLRQYSNLEDGSRFGYKHFLEKNNGTFSFRNPMVEKIYVKKNISEFAPNYTGNLNWYQVSKSLAGREVEKPDENDFWNKVANFNKDLGKKALKRNLWNDTNKNQLIMNYLTNENKKIQDVNKVELFRKPYYNPIRKPYSEAKDNVPIRKLINNEKKEAIAERKISNTNYQMNASRTGHKDWRIDIEYPKNSWKIEIQIDHSKSLPNNKNNQIKNFRRIRSKKSDTNNIENKNKHPKNKNKNTNNETKSKKFLQNLSLFTLMYDDASSDISSHSKISYSDVEKEDIKKEARKYLWSVRPWQKSDRNPDLRRKTRKIIWRIKPSQKSKHDLWVKDVIKEARKLLWSVKPWQEKDTMKSTKGQKIKYSKDNEKIKHVTNGETQLMTDFHKNLDKNNKKLMLKDMMIDEIINEILKHLWSIKMWREKIKDEVINTGIYWQNYLQKSLDKKLKQAINSTMNKLNAKHILNGKLIVFKNNRRKKIPVNEWLNEILKDMINYLRNYKSWYVLGSLTPAKQAIEKSEVPKKIVKNYKNRYVLGSLKPAKQTIKKPGMSKKIVKNYKGGIEENKRYLWNLRPGLKTKPTMHPKRGGVIVKSDYSGEGDMLLKSGPIWTRIEKSDEHLEKKTLPTDEKQRVKSEVNDDYENEFSKKKESLNKNKSGYKLIENSDVIKMNTDEYEQLNDIITIASNYLIDLNSEKNNVSIDEQKSVKNFLSSGNKQFKFSKEKMTQILRYIENKLIKNLEDNKQILSTNDKFLINYIIKRVMKYLQIVTSRQSRDVGNERESEYMVDLESTTKSISNFIDEKHDAVRNFQKSIKNEIVNWLEDVVKKIGDYIWNVKEIEENNNTIKYSHHNKRNVKYQNFRKTDEKTKEKQIISTLKENLKLYEEDEIKNEARKHLWSVKPGQKKDKKQYHKPLVETKKKHLDKNNNKNVLDQKKIVKEKSNIASAEANEIVNQARKYLWSVKPGQKKDNDPGDNQVTEKFKHDKRNVKYYNSRKPISSQNIRHMDSNQNTNYNGKKIILTEISLGNNKQVESHEVENLIKEARKFLWSVKPWHKKDNEKEINNEELIWRGQRKLVTNSHGRKSNSRKNNSDNKTRLLYLNKNAAGKQIRNFRKSKNKPHRRIKVRVNKNYFTNESIPNHKNHTRTTSSVKSINHRKKSKISKKTSNHTSNSDKNPFSDEKWVKDVLKDARKFLWSVKPGQEKDQIIEPTTPKINRKEERTKSSKKMKARMRCNGDTQICKNHNSFLGKESRKSLRLNKTNSLEKLTKDNEYESSPLTIHFNDDDSTVITKNSILAISRNNLFNTTAKNNTHENMLLSNILKEVNKFLTNFESQKDENKFDVTDSRIRQQRVMLAKMLMDYLKLLKTNTNLWFDEKLNKQLKLDEEKSLEKLEKIIQEGESIKKQEQSMNKQFNDQLKFDNLKSLSEKSKDLSDLKESNDDFRVEKEFNVQMQLNDRREVSEEKDSLESSESNEQWELSEQNESNEKNDSKKVAELPELNIPKKINEDNNSDAQHRLTLGKLKKQLKLYEDTKAKRIETLKEQLKLNEKQHSNEELKLEEKMKIDELKKLGEQLKLYEQNKLKRLQELNEQLKLDDQMKIIEQQKLIEVLNRQHKINEQEKLNELQKLNKQLKLYEEKKLERLQLLNEHMKLNKQQQENELIILNRQKKLNEQQKLNEILKLINAKLRRLLQFKLNHITNQLKNHTHANNLAKQISSTDWNNYVSKKYPSLQSLSSKSNESKQESDDSIHSKYSKSNLSNSSLDSYLSDEDSKLNYSSEEDSIDSKSNSKVFKTHSDLEQNSQEDMISEETKYNRNPKHSSKHKPITLSRNQRFSVNPNQSFSSDHQKISTNNFLTTHHPSFHRFVNKSIILLHNVLNSTLDELKKNYNMSTKSINDLILNRHRRSIDFQKAIWQKDFDIPPFGMTDSKTYLRSYTTHEDDIITNVYYGITPKSKLKESSLNTRSNPEEKIPTTSTTVLPNYSALPFFIGELMDNPKPQKAEFFARDIFGGDKKITNDQNIVTDFITPSPTTYPTPYFLSQLIDNIKNKTKQNTSSTTPLPFFIGELFDNNKRPAIDFFTGNLFDRDKQNDTDESGTGVMDVNPKSPFKISFQLQKDENLSLKAKDDMGKPDMTSFDEEYEEDLMKIVDKKENIKSNTSIHLLPSSVLPPIKPNNSTIKKSFDDISLNKNFDGVLSLNKSTNNTISFNQTNIYKTGVIPKNDLANIIPPNKSLKNSPGTSPSKNSSDKIISINKTFDTPTTLVKSASTDTFPDKSLDSTLVPSKTFENSPFLNKFFDSALFPIDSVRHKSSPLEFAYGNSYPFESIHNTLPPQEFSQDPPYPLEFVPDSSIGSVYENSAVVNNTVKNVSIPHEAIKNSSSLLDFLRKSSFQSPRNSSLKPTTGNLLINSSTPLNFIFPLESPNNNSVINSNESLTTINSSPNNSSPLKISNLKSSQNVSVNSSTPMKYDNYITTLKSFDNSTPINQSNLTSTHHNKSSSLFESAKKSFKSITVSEKTLNPLNSSESPSSLRELFSDSKSFSKLITSPLNSSGYISSPNESHKNSTSSNSTKTDLFESIIYSKVKSSNMSEQFVTSDVFELSKLTSSLPLLSSPISPLINSYSTSESDDSTQVNNIAQFFLSSINNSLAKNNSKTANLFNKSPNMYPQLIETSTPQFSTNPSPGTTVYTSGQKFVPSLLTLKNSSSNSNSNNEPRESIVNLTVIPSSGKLFGSSLLKTTNVPSTMTTVSTMKIIPSSTIVVPSTTTISPLTTTISSSQRKYFSSHSTSSNPSTTLPSKNRLVTSFKPKTYGTTGFYPVKNVTTPLIKYAHLSGYPKIELLSRVSKNNSTMTTTLRSGNLRLNSTSNSIFKKTNFSHFSLIDEKTRYKTNDNHSTSTAHEIDVTTPGISTNGIKNNTTLDEIQKFDMISTSDQINSTSATTVKSKKINPKIHSTYKAQISTTGVSSSEITEMTTSSVLSSSSEFKATKNETISHTTIPFEVQNKNNSPTTTQKIITTPRIISKNPIREKTDNVETTTEGIKIFTTEQVFMEDPQILSLVKSESENPKVFTTTKPISETNKKSKENESKKNTTESFVENTRVTTESSEPISRMSTELFKNVSKTSTESLKEIPIISAESLENISRSSTELSKEISNPRENLETSTESLKGSNITEFSTERVTTDSSVNNKNLKKLSTSELLENSTEFLRFKDNDKITTQGVLIENTTTTLSLPEDTFKNATESFLSTNGVTKELSDKISSKKSTISPLEESLLNHRKEISKLLDNSPIKFSTDRHKEHSSIDPIQSFTEIPKIKAETTQKSIENYELEHLTLPWRESSKYLTDSTTENIRVTKPLQFTNHPDDLTPEILIGDSISAKFPGWVQKEIEVTTPTAETVESSTKNNDTSDYYRFLDVVSVHNFPGWITTTAINNELTTSIPAGNLEKYVKMIKTFSYTSEKYPGWVKKSDTDVTSTVNTIDKLDSTINPNKYEFKEPYIPETNKNVTAEINNFTKNIDLFLKNTDFSPIQISPFPIYTTEIHKSYPKTETPLRHLNSITDSSLENFGSTESIKNTETRQPDKFDQTATNIQLTTTENYKENVTKSVYTTNLDNSSNGDNQFGIHLESGGVTKDINKKASNDELKENATRSSMNMEKVLGDGVSQNSSKGTVSRAYKKQNRKGLELSGEKRNVSELNETRKELGAVNGKNTTSQELVNRDDLTTPGYSSKGNGTTPIFGNRNSTKLDYVNRNETKQKIAKKMNDTNSKLIDEENTIKMELIDGVNVGKSTIENKRNDTKTKLTTNVMQLELVNSTKSEFDNKDNTTENVTKPGLFTKDLKHMPSEENTTNKTISTIPSNVSPAARNKKQKIGKIRSLIQSIVENDKLNGSLKQNVPTLKLISSILDLMENLNLDDDRVHDLFTISGLKFEDLNKTADPDRTNLDKVEEIVQNMADTEKPLKQNVENHTNVNVPSEVSTKSTITTRQVDHSNFNISKSDIKSSEISRHESKKLKNDERKTTLLSKPEETVNIYSEFFATTHKMLNTDEMSPNKTISTSHSLYTSQGITSEFEKIKITIPISTESTTETNLKKPGRVDIPFSTYTPQQTTTESENVNYSLVTTVTTTKILKNQTEGIDKLLSIYDSLQPTTQNESEITKNFSTVTKAIPKIIEYDHNKRIDTPFSIYVPTIQRSNEEADNITLLSTVNLTYVSEKTEIQNENFTTPFPRTLSTNLETTIGRITNVPPESINKNASMSKNETVPPLNNTKTVEVSKNLESYRRIDPFSINVTQQPTIKNSKSPFPLSTEATPKFNQTRSIDTPVSVTVPQELLNNNVSGVDNSSSFNITQQPTTQVYDISSSLLTTITTIGMITTLNQSGSHDFSSFNVIQPITQSGQDEGFSITVPTLKMSENLDQITKNYREFATQKQAEGFTGDSYIALQQPVTHLNSEKVNSSTITTIPIVELLNNLNESEKNGGTTSSPQPVTRDERDKNGTFPIVSSIKLPKIINQNASTETSSLTTLSQQLTIDSEKIVNYPTSTVSMVELPNNLNLTFSIENTTVNSVSQQPAIPNVSKEIENSTIPTIPMIDMNSHLVTITTPYISTQELSDKIGYSSKATVPTTVLSQIINQTLLTDTSLTTVTQQPTILNESDTIGYYPVPTTPMAELNKNQITTTNIITSVSPTIQGEKIKNILRATELSKITTSEMGSIGHSTLTTMTPSLTPNDRKVANSLFPIRPLNELTTILNQIENITSSAPKQYVIKNESEKVESTSKAPISLVDLNKILNQIASIVNSSLAQKPASQSDSSSIPIIPIEKLPTILSQIESIVNSSLGSVIQIERVKSSTISTTSVSEITKILSSSTSVPQQINEKENFSKTEIPELPKNQTTSSVHPQFTIAKLDGSSTIPTTQIDLVENLNQTIKFDNNSLTTVSLQPTLEDSKNVNSSSLIVPTAETFKEINLNESIANSSFTLIPQESGIPNLITTIQSTPIPTIPMEEFSKIVNFTEKIYNSSLSTVSEQSTTQAVNEKGENSPIISISTDEVPTNYDLTTKSDNSSHFIVPQKPTTQEEREKDIQFFSTTTTTLKTDLNQIKINESTTEGVNSRFKIIPSITTVTTIKSPLNQTEITNNVPLVNVLQYSTTQVKNRNISPITTLTTVIPKNLNQTNGTQNPYSISLSHQPVVNNVTKLIHSSPITSIMTIDIPKNLTNIERIDNSFSIYVPEQPSQNDSVKDPITAVTTIELPTNSNLIERIKTIVSVYVPQSVTIKNASDKIENITLSNTTTGLHNVSNYRRIDTAFSIYVRDNSDNKTDINQTIPEIIKISTTTFDLSTESTKQFIQKTDEDLMKSTITTQKSLENVTSDFMEKTELTKNKTDFAGTTQKIPENTENINSSSVISDLSLEKGINISTIQTTPKYLNDTEDKPQVIPDMAKMKLNISKDFHTDLVQKVAPENVSESKVPTSQTIPDNNNAVTNSNSKGTYETAMGKENNIHIPENPANIIRQINFLLTKLVSTYNYTDPNIHNNEPSFGPAKSQNSSLHSNLKIRSNITIIPGNSTVSSLNDNETNVSFIQPNSSKNLNESKVLLNLYNGSYSNPSSYSQLNVNNGSETQILRINVEMSSRPVPPFYHGLQGFVVNTSLFGKISDNYMVVEKTNSTNIQNNTGNVTDILEAMFRSANSTKIQNYTGTTDTAETTLYFEPNTIHTQSNETIEASQTLGPNFVDIQNNTTEDETVSYFGSNSTTNQNIPVNVVDESFTTILNLDPNSIENITEYINVENKTSDKMINFDLSYTDIQNKTENITEVSENFTILNSTLYTRVIHSSFDNSSQDANNSDVNITNVHIYKTMRDLFTKLHPQLREFQNILENHVLNNSEITPDYKSVFELTVEKPNHLLHTVKKINSLLTKLLSNTVDFDDNQEAINSTTINLMDSYSTNTPSKDQAMFEKLEKYYSINFETKLSSTQDYDLNEETKYATTTLPETISPTPSDIYNRANQSAKLLPKFITALSKLASKLDPHIFMNNTANNSLKSDPTIRQLQKNFDNYTRDISKVVYALLIKLSPELADQSYARKVRTIKFINSFLKKIAKSEDYDKNYDDGKTSTDSEEMKNKENPLNKENKKVINSKTSLDSTNSQLLWNDTKGIIPVSKLISGMVDSKTEISNNTNYNKKLTDLYKKLSTLISKIHGVSEYHLKTNSTPILTIGHYKLPINLVVPALNINIIDKPKPTSQTLINNDSDLMDKINKFEKYLLIFDSKLEGISKEVENAVKLKHSDQRLSRADFSEILTKLFNQWKQSMSNFTHVLTKFKNETLRRINNNSEINIALLNFLERYKKNKQTSDMSMFKEAMGKYMKLYFLKNEKDVVDKSVNVGKEDVVDKFMSNAETVTEKKREMVTKRMGKMKVALLDDEEIDTISNNGDIEDATLFV